MRQALAQLAFEGVIHRQAGLGTFVASPPVEAKLDTRLRQSFEEQIEAAGLRVTFELLAFDEEKAPASVRETMGLRDDSPVWRLRRLRLVNGNLIGLEEMTTVGDNIDTDYAREILARGVRMISYSADALVFRRACQDIAGLKVMASEAA